MELIEPTRGVREFADAVLRTVKRHMFGMDEVVRLALVALCTDGHVLLEGNPGFGKTELVKTLSAVLKLPFGRIQFTPDLMPADITGTFMPDLAGSSKWKFRNGPIFTSLLLADEINRATPKTQSAMLEAMAERQVTVLGEKWPLKAPFMVLATQNPIDHEGTYNLPEAQADRFMFKITMPVPDGDTLRLIVEKRVGAMAAGVGGEGMETPPISPLLPKDEKDSREKYENLRRRIARVRSLRSLDRHIKYMFLASNRRFEEMEKEHNQDQVERVKRLVNELMTYGLGPRAAITLTLGAKAWALMFSPDPEMARADGVALARVVIPTLRHRVKLDLDWEDRYHEIVKEHSQGRRRAVRQDDGGNVGLLERLLADFCRWTAPRTDGYHSTVDQALDRVLAERGW